MPRFTHKYLDIRRLIGELVLAVLLLVLVFLLTARFDVSEWLMEWAMRHEAYELDDILLSVLIVGPVYLLVFAWRRHREMGKLVEEANTDVLTGILNRRRAMELLTREVRRSHRYHRQLSVILFDIDHFKQINDQFGHPAGDRVLQSFANLASARMRDLDLMARTGGEEFMVIATETGGEGAVELAERLRSAVETTSFGIDQAVTASFGVSQLRPGESSATLMQRADERLYWAKRGGRNRVSGPGATAAKP
ncbi:GGDEF domain-containing protein [Marinobacterium mangrovicola]|uniref:diguanylate cyclase n=1 Tax=Marinobacterium mangrovicola TaxID=1476959 RepID=A0A4R1GTB5_9GAMM|nr:GGDEF domain-containing protein [Marinobacterium mangrovicola]TCK09519.1 diguanylate cyclase (GGDEF)-like protein [Marinobacterium mangrovicola]